MPDWNAILDEHGEAAWQAVCRIVPAEKAPAVFTASLLAGHEGSQRDAVSDWHLFIQHCATRAAIAALKQQPPVLPAPASLAEQLRSALAQLSDQGATVFCLRYLSGITFPGIAMEIRAPIDSIGPTANEACTQIGRRLAANSPAAAGAAQLADDLVEAAVNEVRSAAAPPLSRELLEQTREALNSAPLIDFEKPPVPSREIPISIAAFAMVAIAFGVWAYFTYREKPPAMSFAQMVEAIASESSAKYHLARNVVLPDRRTRKLDSEITEFEPGKLRQVTEPQGDVVIWDSQKQKVLTLDEAKQRATLRDWGDMFDESRPIDAVALLKQFKAEDGKPSHQTTLHGRPAQGFKVNSDGNEISVWADVESKLPIIVEMKLPKASPPGDAIMNEFVWGPPLDATQFTLEPPAGYELAAIKVNLKPATEVDLVKALAVAAQLNGGKFPDQFDRVGMSQLITELYKKLPDKKSPGYRAAVEDLEANLLQLGRGWMYIAEAENGDQWFYAGKGVMYGSRTPVLWYRPAGSKTYRVVDASLDIRSILPEKLPDVAAVQLARPTTRPTVTPQLPR